MAESSTSCYTFTLRLTQGSFSQQDLVTSKHHRKVKHSTGVDWSAGNTASTDQTHTHHVPLACILTQQPQTLNFKNLPDFYIPNARIRDPSQCCGKHVNEHLFIPSFHTEPALTRLFMEGRYSNIITLANRCYATR